MVPRRGLVNRGNKELEHQDIKKEADDDEYDHLGVDCCRCHAHVQQHVVVPVLQPSTPNTIAGNVIMNFWDT